MEIKLMSLLLIVGTGLVLCQAETATEYLTSVITELTEIATTTMQDTPTSAPTPTGHFRVNGSDDQACILENIHASFSINYTKHDNSTNMIIFELPQNSQVVADDSKCTNNTQGAVLALTWGPSKERNRFTQIFSNANETSQLAVITLRITHTQSLFPNSTEQDKLMNYTTTLPAGTFLTDFNYSFSCNSEEYFKIDSNSDVTFTDVRVQTLDIAQSVFSPPTVCPQDMNATTESPSTTGPTPAPRTTPTPAPTPAPSPEGNWTVKGKNGTTCIRVNMTMQFIISYNTTSKKEAKVSVSLPSNADTSNSTCEGKTAKFVLTFPGMESDWYAEVADTWQLEMDFLMDGSSYNITKFSLSYVYDGHFKNASQNGTAAEASTNELTFTVDKDHYYACNTNSSFQSNAGSGNVTFYMQNASIQPFATNITVGYGFGDASPCDADESFNNIVPIAVGCALAGLVIIVLIAYLIGRQRSSKTGYESV